MRPIRFRAWNKKKGGWEELGSYTPMNPLTGKLMEDEDNSCSDPECCGGPTPMFGDQDHYIIEQFTGLLDKNGEEIYEGDLVEAIESRPSICKGERGIVEWCDFGFSVKNIPPFDWDPMSPTFRLGATPLLVIGNVHEHPELLKKDGGKGK